MPQVAVSASETYARCLLSHCHGYALWVPEPYGAVAKHGLVGIRIGDVGYVTDDGAFESLFNVRVNADHPLQQYGVPQGFEPLIIEERHIELVPQFHPPGAIASKAAVKEGFGGNLGISGSPSPVTPASGAAGIEYSWNSSSGAILHLPNGAHRCDLPPAYIKDYAIRHAESWYDFAGRELRRGVPSEKGSLFVVTGYDKTDSWMVGAFSDQTSTANIPLRVNALGGLEGDVRFEYDWVNHTSPTYRIGPWRRDQTMPPEGTTNRAGAIDNPGTPLQEASAGQHSDSFEPNSPEVLMGSNQCVFVRGWYIKIAKKLLGREKPVEATAIEHLKPFEVVRRSIQSSMSGRGCGEAYSPSESSQAAVAGTSSSQADLTMTDDNYISNDELVDGIQLEYMPNTAERYHPCMILNDFLLQTAPEATMALCHDDDWCFLGKKETSFPWEELPRYVQVADNVAFFAFPSSADIVDNVDADPGARVDSEA